MAATADGSASSETPIPPRYWWLKRGAVLVLVVVGALAIVHLVWGHLAERRYRAFIDGAHARGEPILPEDFDGAPVADGQNKAAYLLKAEAAIQKGREFTAFTRTYDIDAALPAGALEQLAGFIKTNAEALRLARAARAAMLADWKLPLRSPVINSPAFKHATDQRELAKLLSWTAVYYHQTSNDREAVESLRDIVDQADTLGRGPSSLVVELVSIGMDAMAIEDVHLIAPTLKIGAGDASGAVTRQQVSQFISTLLDDEPYRRKAVRGWFGERMYGLDTISSILDDSGRMKNVGANAALPPFRANIRLEAVRAARMSDAGRKAVEQANWPAAQAVMPNLDYNTSELEEVSSIMSRMLTPSVNRGAEQYFREMLERRVAAVELAIRWYRIDHGDTYPEKLADLVPAYLPAVPADPFAADGRPLSYRTRPAPPAVYSVGMNGTDEGGTSLPVANPPGPMSRWECADIVYPLEPLPAATQPVSGN